MIKSNITRRRIGDTLAYIFLGVMGIIWILPVVWILFESFNSVQSQITDSFFPTSYTLSNYVDLFTNTTVIPFVQQFMNSLIIAIASCIISTVFVLAVSFCLSRLRFKFRKPFMNIALTLGMFPGIMSVIILYFLLKEMGLAGSVSPVASLIGLILVYSAGSGAGFFIMKGYMDTIPMSLDEAAYIDGCTRWQVFTRIILPICKPMIVYQALVGFLAPWLDFVLANVIVGNNGTSYMTVSVGLYNILNTPDLLSHYFPWFAAGAVCVSIPIAILFIVMQRFYTESMSGAVKG